MNKQATMEEIYSGHGYTVFRARESRNSSKALKPERIEIEKDGELAAVLAGIDAEDFIDQLTHTNDMPRVCALTAADERWAVAKK